MTKNDFDVGEWFSEKENRIKFFKFMVAMNLIALSVLLFITANGSGALYEVLKPSDNTINYTIVDINQKNLLESTYDDMYTLTVIELNDNFEEIGEIQEIHLGYDFSYITNLNIGDRISIRYIKQKFEDEYIYSIAKCLIDGKLTPVVVFV